MVVESEITYQCVCNYIKYSFNINRKGKVDHRYVGSSLFALSSAPQHHGNPQQHKRKNSTLALSPQRRVYVDAAVESWGMKF